VRRETASTLLRDLFLGRIDLNQLEPFPLLPTKAFLEIEPLIQALRRPSEHRGVALLQELELLGTLSPLPLPLEARLVEQLGAADPSAALSFIAHHALGMKLIRRFGSVEARESIGGQAIFAFAMTEASPGSDVSQVQTIAQNDGQGYRIFGKKHWVTNGLFASHFVVVARTTPSQPGNKPRLTAFVVPRSAEVICEPVRSDVLPASGVAEVQFDGAFVPESGVIGAFGKGFRTVMSGLSEARLLLSAAISGASIRAYTDTIERLNQRRAFGRPVGNFPSVQERIATLLSDTFALQSLVHLVAGLGEDELSADPLERGLARLAASRISARVLDATRELHGAAAFSGDVAQSRRWADTRALALLDGSDLALESFIVLEATRDLGRAGRLDDPPKPERPPNEGPRGLVDRLWSTRAQQAPDAAPGCRPRALEALTRELGNQVKHQFLSQGAEFVEHQHAHRRIANAALELAVWLAVLMRVRTEVKRVSVVGAERMIDAATLFTHAAEERVRRQFDHLTHNEDELRDRIARRAYADGSFPFDITL
jgi:acyl-CoA dehydrogenase family member 9